ncbi:c-type cytochrome [Aquidulcibacter sp.]|jgi:cytochrome c|uniref:c-type cytochrome n=1 Tax=Aquidulcibacter sp. TaxID=2052990 RepID=UPI003BA46893
MKRQILGSGIAVSLAALALVAGCGQQASQKAEAPAAATEAAAPATNEVAAAPAAEAPATNEVAAAAAPADEAAAPAAAAAAPAAGAMVLAIKDKAGATLSGDPVKGEAVFRQCQTCHVVTAGVNKVGPSLHNIIGRPAGQVAGFRYSEANKNSGITWTEQEIYTYLENPKARVPGTIMAFVGVKDSQKRADLVAYLKTHTN